MEVARLSGLVEITGIGAAERALQGFGTTVDRIGDRVSKAGSVMGRGFDMAGKSLLTLGKIAGGAAVVGIGAVGTGFLATIKSGLSFNSTLEDTTAKLLAFTGSQEEAAKVLEMVRQRAASTPFAFNEMADATAALLPVSKQSGAALEDLIGTAEVLAALNPAEGLAGAAFALREATGGDFLSIVERFNLPKKRLQELQAQGIPAIEAVRIAMKEMGVDASLVSNLAGTMSGRWSTFMDTLQGLAATMTGPLFTAMSTTLGGLQTYLDANTEGMTAFATSIGEKLGGAFNWLVTTGGPAVLGVMQSLWNLGQILFAGDFTGKVFGLHEDDPMIDTLFTIRDTAIAVFGWFMTTGLPGLQTAFQLAWPIITSAVAATYDYLSGTVWPWLRDTAFPWLQNEAMPAVQTAFETAWPIIEGAVRSFSTFLHDVVWPGVKEVFNWIKDTGLPEVVREFEEAWPRNQATIQTFIDFLNNDFTPAEKTAIAEEKAALGESQMNWQQWNIDTGAAMDTFYTDLMHLADESRLGWQTMYTDLQTTVVNWSVQLTLLATTAEKKVAEVVVWFAGLPGRIGEAVGDMSSTLVTAGRSVISGLLSGITAAWSEKGASVLGAITSAIPKLKGPPERDAQLLYDNGRVIMEGLMRGIAEGFVPVQKILASVTDQIEAQAAAAAQNMSKKMKWALSIPQFADDGITTIWEQMAANAERAAGQIKSSIGPIVVSARQAIESLLKTGDFRGGIFGLEEDDPFISFLLKARTDTTALQGVLSVLQKGDFRGGIFGLEEDDPFIDFLLRAYRETGNVTKAVATLGKAGAASMTIWDQAAQNAINNVAKIAKDWSPGTTVWEQAAGNAMRSVGDMARAWKPTQETADDITYANERYVVAPMLSLPEQLQRAFDQVDSQLRGDNPMQKAIDSIFDQFTNNPMQEALDGLFSGGGGEMGASDPMFASILPQTAIDEIRQRASEVRGEFEAPAWQPVIVGTDDAFLLVQTTIHDHVATAGQHLMEVVDLSERRIKDLMNRIDSLNNKIGNIKSIPGGDNPTPFGGFRAEGGPVVPGRGYVVGERGPEYITPTRPGYVTPNQSGSSMTISEGAVVINLPAGTPQETAMAARGGVIDAFAQMGIRL